MVAVIHRPLEESPRPIAAAMEANRLPIAARPPIRLLIAASQPNRLPIAASQPNLLPIAALRRRLRITSHVRVVIVEQLLWTTTRVYVVPEVASAEKVPEGETWTNRSTGRVRETAERKDRRLADTL